MKTTYETSGWMKLAEEDSYEHGCTGKPIYNSGTDDFSAGTIPELLKKIQRFFCVEDNGVLLDSCEEDGRLDLQCMENDDGCIPCESEKQQWKEGKLRLWAVTYTVTVERVARETVALSEAAAS